MARLRVIGGLIGELADRVLDYLERKADKETEGIEETERIEASPSYEDDPGPDPRSSNDRGSDIPLHFNVWRDDERDDEK